MELEFEPFANKSSQIYHRAKCADEFISHRLVVDNRSSAYGQLQNWGGRSVCTVVIASGKQSETVRI